MVRARACLLIPNPPVLQVVYLHKPSGVLFGGAPLLLRPLRPLWKSVWCSSCRCHLRCEFWNASRGRCRPPIGANGHHCPLSPCRRHPDAHPPQAHLGRGRGCSAGQPGALLLSMLGSCCALFAARLRHPVACSAAHLAC